MCEERKDRRPATELATELIKATSAIRNKCYARSTKEDVQYVIVNGLRGNNEKNCHDIKNNGEQLSHSTFRYDVCSVW